MGMSRNAAVLALVIVSQSVLAQPRELTLTRAVELAREHAPQLQAQAAVLDSAQSNAIAAGRLPDPELVTGIDNLPVTGEDAGSLSRDFMTMRKIGVMQPFPNARKRSADRQGANAAIAVAQAQARLTDLEVSRLAAEAWVATFAAESLYQRLRALQPELELQARTANATLASGRGSSVDALAAQAALIDLQDQLLAAQRDRRSARSMLARWVGEDDAASALGPAPSFESLSTERSAILNELHRHASVAEYEARISVAQSEIDRAKADARPDWSAELSYAKRGSTFSDMVSLEFRVGLPLFGGNRQQPMIRAKRAQLRQLESEREAQLRMHREEVALMLAEWESLRDRRTLYERERLPLARQQTQVAVASYQANVTTLAMVLSSVAAEIQLQVNYAALQRDLGRAWAFLEYLQPEQVTP